jgi:hypothetical protein
MGANVHARRLQLIALAAVVTLAGFLAASRHAQAQSSELSSVLSTIRNFDTFTFDRLSGWAKNGTPKPDDPVFQPAKVELDILNLGDGDRNAVLAWLRGNGRAALHAQGANDSDIGPARSSVETVATPKPTPNPWRAVPLASSSLDVQTQKNIQVLGGFAAMKKDGTAAIACLSFKNKDPRVAKRVVVDFPITGDGGQPLGKLTLDRAGEFSPNIDILSYASIEQWQGHGVGPVRSFNEGCVQRNLPTAAMPFLQAQAVGYTIVQVDYADGTSTAAAPPAPAAPPAVTPQPK